MARMGHDDMCAALNDQRATVGDRPIADQMSDLLDGHPPDGDDLGDGDDGASGAPARLR